MSERIQFRQNRDFQVEFRYADPQQEAVDQLHTVQGLHEVTPYGMMLFSLASCTAQVVLGYANHHQLNLEEVKLDLIYERDFLDDCENCEELDQINERIRGRIVFIGDLPVYEREKLLKISRQCPIEKIFAEGIRIDINLGEEKS